MKTYKTLSGLSLLLAVVLFPAVASAHVVVKPAQVDVAAEQTFSMGVPNEKTSAVTQLKLAIPDGLDEVSPTVKPGWTIQVTKDGNTVKDITWTGGTIPAGQRDDFTFSAQAPTKAGELDWKAYQTYADGTTVSWDQKPDGTDSEDTTPYSVTKVTDDLTATAAKPSTPESHQNTTLPTIIGIIAWATSIVAIVGLVMHRKRA